MEWRESINNNLRETYHIFYELNLSQHNQAQIEAIRHYLRLAQIPTEGLNDFLQSEEGQNFMKQYREFTKDIEETDDPEALGKEVAEKIYSQQHGLGASNV